jgi:hypothetical protein
MNKFETRQLIVDNWFRKEKPLGPGKKGTFEKQTQMTKELKKIVKNVDFYLFDISMLDNYDYNFRDREILSEIFNQMKKGAIHYIWWTDYHQGQCSQSGHNHWNGHGVGQNEDNDKSLFDWLWKQKFHLTDSEGSAASREKHRTIARSLLIDIFETYMIYFSEFKYNDGSSPNLTEQQKSDILNEIYEAFHIYKGFDRNRNLFASSICICESCRELDDHEEFN